MPVTENEKLGLRDLFINQHQNTALLLNLARTLSKNIFNADDPEEAYNIVCTHADDIRNLLYKRNVTKDILYNYLTSRNVSVGTEFTKLTLVNKICEYWSSFNPNIENISSGTSKPDSEHSLARTNEAGFPINTLAREFTEWFFSKYNNGGLVAADMWPDTRLDLRIAANDATRDYTCNNADRVVETLMNSKDSFNFFFNPNLSHEGVQGRIDKHGLVLVLACGTLHTHNNCVGVFECNFGLLRDPYSANNYKVKTIHCILRSESTGLSHLHTLNESSTLQNALQLPVRSLELP